MSSPLDTQQDRRANYQLKERQNLYDLYGAIDSNILIPISVKADVISVKANPSFGSVPNTVMTFFDFQHFMCECALNTFLAQATKSIQYNVEN